MRIRLGHERSIHHTEGLTSYHSFSYGSQIEPDWMNFGALKIFSECTLTPSSQISLKLSQSFLIIIAVSEGVEILCKNYGKKELENGESFSTSQDSTESITLLNPLQTPSKFFWIESSQNLNLQLRQFKANETLQIPASSWFHLLEGSLKNKAVRFDAADAIENEQPSEVKAHSHGKAILLQVPT